MKRFLKGCIKSYSYDIPIYVYIVFVFGFALTIPSIIVASNSLNRIAYELLPLLALPFSFLLVEYVKYKRFLKKLDTLNDGDVINKNYSDTKVEFISVVDNEVYYRFLKTTYYSLSNNISHHRYNDLGKMNKMDFYFNFVNTPGLVQYILNDMDVKIQNRIRKLKQDKLKEEVETIRQINKGEHDELIKKLNYLDRIRNSKNREEVNQIVNEIIEESGILR